MGGRPDGRPPPNGGSGAAGTPQGLSSLRGQVPMSFGAFPMLHRQFTTVGAIPNPNGLANMGGSAGLSGGLSVGIGAAINGGLTPDHLPVGLASTLGTSLGLSSGFTSASLGGLGMGGGIAGFEAARRAAERGMSAAPMSSNGLLSGFDGAGDTSSLGSSFAGLGEESGRNSPLAHGDDCDRDPLDLEDEEQQQRKNEEDFNSWLADDF